MISSISAWIMSIAGVVCISVLVELIMPSGQMNRYIKGIFSFIILLVIISPIPKLLKKEFDFDNMFGQSEIVVQGDFLEEINYSKISSMQNRINEEIKNLGYINVEARIDADIFEQNMKIKAVYVDISKIVINQEATHTNIQEVKKDILEIVTGIVKIENQRVVFDE